MTDHAERIVAARSVIDDICGRSDKEQAVPVPNCPGWTVYNAASHIGRVGIAWEEMIRSSPDDPESRARGYERSGRQPVGTPMAELAAWAHSAIDHLVDDPDRQCYFSMTGGEGTARLWAWHAASELGMHRLDVEMALGHEHSMTPTHALDAADCTCRFFLQAMRCVLERRGVQRRVAFMRVGHEWRSRMLGPQQIRADECAVGFVHLGVWRYAAYVWVENGWHGEVLGLRHHRAVNSPDSGRACDEFGA